MWNTPHTNYSDGTPGPLAFSQNAREIDKGNEQENASSVFFFSASTDIVQGFTSVIVLASLGVYIKLSSASPCFTLRTHGPTWPLSILKNTEV